MRKYGQILKLERKTRKLSQEYLAREIGITQQAVSYYENDINIPSIDIIEAIADVYGISIDELIDHEIKRNW